MTRPVATVLLAVDGANPVCVGAVTITAPATAALEVVALLRGIADAWEAEHGIPLSVSDICPGN